MLVLAKGVESKQIFTTVFFAITDSINAKKTLVLRFVGVGWTSKYSSKFVKLRRIVFFVHWNKMVTRANRYFDL